MLDNRALGAYRPRGKSGAESNVGFSDRKPFAAISCLRILRHYFFQISVDVSIPGLWQVQLSERRQRTEGKAYTQTYTYKQDDHVLWFLQGSTADLAVGHCKVKQFSVYKKQHSMKGCATYLDRFFSTYEKVFKYIFHHLYKQSHPGNCTVLIVLIFSLFQSSILKYEKFSASSDSMVCGGAIIGRVKLVGRN